MVGDACKTSRGNAHSPDVLGTARRALDGPDFSRRLSHDYGSGSVAVFDRNGGARRGAGHGALALWSQALATYSGRLFTGVRTGQVDYNCCYGALLCGRAHRTTGAG